MYAPTQKFVKLKHNHYLCRMKTFAEFIDNAKTNLCAEYTEKLNKAGSKKSLIDIALDANGMPWVCEAVAKGKLSSDTIAEDFKPFLNGRYIRAAGGYSSALYCKRNDGIEVVTTCALIVDCKGVIRVDRPIAELFLSNSDVAIISNKGSKVNVYLYNSSVVNNEFIVVRESKRYGTI